MSAGVAEKVITLLDKIKHVDYSIDWRGQMNWEKLGSQTHCWRCGGEFGKDIESGSQVRHHIIPTSEGGPDTDNNRSLLCGNCHNVVHRFYLPTDRIGKKRTRDGKWRRVVKFDECIEISQDIPAANGSLSSCRECESCGIVVSVSEGYWDGEGMMIFLICSKCEHRFAVPFIGTKGKPEIDTNAVFFADLDRAFAKTAESLPTDLAEKQKKFGNSLISILRACTRELKISSRIARLTGISKEEHERQIFSIRNDYIEKIKALIPEASELEIACMSYAKESGT